jgi:hypothetical protein
MPFHFCFGLIRLCLVLSFQKLFNYTFKFGITFYTDFYWDWLIVII